MEFYDFALFAALLPLLAPILFPSESMHNSFNASYIILGVGFWTRPIGAIIFGYIGDKYSRKIAWNIALLMMTIATISIGILPTAKSIGIFSLYILIFLRILQGLSSGGEYSGASVMLAEQDKNNTFLNSAMLIAAGLGGGCLASISAAIVSADIFPAYSWRFLFLIGGGIGIYIIYRQIANLEFQSNKSNVKSTTPWFNLLTKNKLALFSSICISAMSTQLFMINTFINTYFVSTMAYSKTTLMLINATLSIICAIALIAFGILTKRYNPQKMMLCGATCITLFIAPFYVIVYSGSMFLFILAEIIMVLFVALFFAPSAAITASFFPYEIRYRGVALGNCIGLAISGTCPYICSSLITHTNAQWSPAIYLIVVGLFGIIASLIALRSSQSELYNYADINNNFAIQTS